VLRQAPGLLWYREQMQKKFGAIPPRFTPLRFIYDVGPIHLQEDEDRDWYVEVYITRSRKKKAYEGDLTITDPAGKTVARLHVNSHTIEPYTPNRLRVPKDGRTGTYVLRIGLPLSRGTTHSFWGVHSPILRKMAIQTTGFTFDGGHIFFYVPKGTKEFQLYVRPRGYTNPCGQIPIHAPNGRLVRLFYARGDANVTIRPRLEETGGVWSTASALVGDFRMVGLPPYVYQDPADFFLPDKPADIH